MALIIRTGFWGPLYYNYKKEPPKIILVNIKAPIVRPVPINLNVGPRRQQAGDPSLQCPKTSNTLPWVSREWRNGVQVQLLLLPFFHSLLTKGRHKEPHSRCVVMRMSVCTYACMYVYMYACMYACMHVHACMYIYIYVCLAAEHPPVLV